MIPKSILADEITITRQEGDTSAIEIEVPEIISLAGRNIHFEVFKGREGIFKKVNYGDRQDWTVTGQEIETRLDEADTKGHAGKWRYELEVWDADYVYTILKGDFIIERELITKTRHE